MRVPRAKALAYGIPDNTCVHHVILRYVAGAFCWGMMRRRCCGGSWRMCQDPEHDAAITFVVLGIAPEFIIVQNIGRPHKFIYNALMQCASAKSSRWKGILKDYGCDVIKGKLSADVLVDFGACYRLDHGFPRYKVISGRAWSALLNPIIGDFGALAFWNDPANVSPAIIDTVSEIFDITGTTFVGFAGKGSSWLNR